MRTKTESGQYQHLHTHPFVLTQGQPFDQKLIKTNSWTFFVPNLAWVTLRREWYRLTKYPTSN